MMSLYVEFFELRRSREMLLPRVAVIRTSCSAPWRNYAFLVRGEKKNRTNAYRGVGSMFVWKFEHEIANFLGRTCSARQVVSRNFSSHTEARYRRRSCVTSRPELAHGVPYRRFSSCRGVTLRQARRSSGLYEIFRTCVAQLKWSPGLMLL